MPLPSTLPSQIKPLTSLRFFAALYVVLFHTLAQAFPAAGGTASFHGRLLGLGFIAVSFFFTLSGYVLAISYLPRQVSKGQFWWARFARVYPLFLLTLLIDTPQYYAGIAKQMGPRAALHITALRLGENVLLLQAWVPHFRAMNFPNWSLSVEALFYLACPLLLLLVRRSSAPALVIACVTTYVLGMAAIAVGLDAHVSLSVLKFFPLLHLPTFICGVLLGSLRTRIHLQPRYAPFLLGGAIACFFITVHAYPRVPLPYVHDGLLLPAFACLLLAFDSGNRTLDLLLSARWLVVLGEASYALYLIHIPLWHVLYHLRLDHSMIAYSIYLAFAVTLSVLSFYYFETPVRRALTSGARLALGERHPARHVHVLVTIPQPAEAPAVLSTGTAGAAD